MRYAFTVVVAAFVVGMLIWATRPADEERRRWRLVWAVFAVVFIFGALSFTWIQSVAKQGNDRAEDNCHNAEDFRALLANARTFALRDLQERRDDLADRTANVETNVSETPGYAELPDSVKQFFAGLIASSIAMNEAQIAEYDAQLKLARAELDQIRSFVLRVDCPGEAEDREEIPIITGPSTT